MRFNHRYRLPSHPAVRLSTGSSATNADHNPSPSAHFGALQDGPRVEYSEYAGVDHGEAAAKAFNAKESISWLLAQHVDFRKTPNSAIETTARGSNRDGLQGKARPGRMTRLLIAAL